MMSLVYLTVNRIEFINKNMRVILNEPGSFSLSFILSAYCLSIFQPVCLSCCLSAVSLTVPLWALRLRLLAPDFSGLHFPSTTQWEIKRKYLHERKPLCKYANIFSPMEHPDPYGVHEDTLLGVHRDLCSSQDCPAERCV